MNTITQLTPGTLTTDKNAAAALGICRTSIWNLAKAGHLNPVKLTGKTTRFRTDEILNLIEHGVTQ